MSASQTAGQNARQMCRRCLLEQPTLSFSGCLHSLPLSPTCLAATPTRSVAHKLMRTETLDWVPIPLWVACAGNALRAGLAQFPDSAFLNIQLGTFEAVLRQEASVGGRQWVISMQCSVRTVQGTQSWRWLEINS